MFPDESSIGNMENGTALNYDIALGFLDEPQDGAPLGVLPTDDEAEGIATGAEVSIVGWGQTSQTGPAGVKYWGDLRDRSGLRLRVPGRSRPRRRAPVPR